MATYTLYGNFGSDVRVILKVTLFDLEHITFCISTLRCILCTQMYTNKKCQIDKTYGTSSRLITMHIFWIHSIFLL